MGLVQSYHALFKIRALLKLRQVPSVLAGLDCVQLCTSTAPRNFCLDAAHYNCLHRHSVTVRGREQTAIGRALRQ
eukprot:SAG11_NODE_1562_length_4676_cov_2.366616_4_plen_75_part_00